MSDAAIATVTSALCRLLGDQTQTSTDHVPGTQVTTLPLDKAQEGEGNRINLFLYNISINGAWHNMDQPTWNRAGGEGSPPLAVDLYYLLTAYAPGGDDANLASQHLLGQAMRIFKDNTLLNPTPHEQIEGIRITPQPLSLDEMSKLWTTFQTQYRTSVAYQVSVILIDSLKESLTPLPVLQRGRDDRGVITQPDLIPPVPTLINIILPNKQPALHWSDEWVIEGHHLQGDQPPIVQLMHPRLDEAISVSNLRGHTDTQIILNLEDEPDATSRFPPGLYRLAVVVTSIEDGQAVPGGTNELPLPLAPKVVTLQTQLENDTRILTVTCEPNLLPDQQVTLFVGSKAFSEYTFATNPDGSDKHDTLIFTIDLVPGKYLVRLRIDGVDSMPVANYATVPLTFDEQQLITIDG